MTRLTVVWLLVTVAACGKMPTEAELRVSCAADPAQFDTMPRFATLDYQFAYVAARSPGGFAGIFYNEGQLQFRLKDLSKAREAADVIGPLLQRSPAELHAVPATYDWLELYGCYQRVHLSGGINFTDIDEFRNRLVYGLRHDSFRSRVESEIRASGIPEGMWIVELSSPGVLADR
ncbi:MAG TPA: hypothetical protein VM100_11275 [Longimicrobiales bacterium]|nr:hypothetical protein [Longimicrobiales bacterium]